LPLSDERLKEIARGHYTLAGVITPTYTINMMKDEMKEMARELLERRER